MKAIINKKSYDTETATNVATYNDGIPTSDFQHYSETLYITKKGRWFTAGGGGPMSKYAVSHGNETSGSERIEVLTDEEAYCWLELHDETDSIEHYFKDSFEEA